MPKLFCLFLVLLFFSCRLTAAEQPQLATDTLNFSRFYQTRHAINHAFARITRDKETTVAFMGGSITFNPGWRQLVCNYLRQRFPQTHFRFIAAGIPSLGSLPHAFRLQRDILDSGKVDLMFLEAAVNDRVNHADSLTQIRDLEGIVRHARRANPEMDIVLMEFADPYKNEDYDHGRMPVEVGNHEAVAEKYSLPSINLAKEVHDKISNKEFSWDGDFKDLHPSPFGQKLYAQTIIDFLEKCARLYKPDTSLTHPAKLPRPLDAANFSNGSYLPPAQAQFTNGWRLVPDWQPADQAATRQGFVHVPVLESTDTAQELSLSFKGNAIGIAVVSGPDAGIITYQIDCGPAKKLDLYTEWSGGLHLPWYLLLGSGLKPGNHVLRLKVTARPKQQNGGNVCRIVYFLVNEPDAKTIKYGLNKLKRAHRKRFAIATGYRKPLGKLITLRLGQADFLTKVNACSWPPDELRTTLKLSKAKSS